MVRRWYVPSLPYVPHYDEQPYPGSKCISLFCLLFPQSLLWAKRKQPESSQNIFDTAVHVFTPWGSTDTPYQGLSLNKIGHCNYQATWGLWRAFRHKTFGTCYPLHVKWLSPGTLTGTQSAVCADTATEESRGPWGPEEGAAWQRALSSMRTLSPLDFHSKHLHTELAKATKQESYKHLTGSDRSAELQACAHTTSPPLCSTSTWLTRGMAGEYPGQPWLPLKHLYQKRPLELGRFFHLKIRDSPTVLSKPFSWKENRKWHFFVNQISICYMPFHWWAFWFFPTQVMLVLAYVSMWRWNEIPPFDCTLFCLITLQICHH